MTGSVHSRRRRGVVVLDYGSGNLRSAQRALQRVGADVEVTADVDAAMNADGLVVPGVGAFEACMTGLRKISGDKIIADRSLLSSITVSVPRADGPDSPGASYGRGRVRLELSGHVKDDVPWAEKTTWTGLERLRRTRC